MTALHDRLEDLLGIGVRRLAPVRGGDVAEAYRVELSNGGVVFAKTHAAPPPDFFRTEATGLGWLRDALVGTDATAPSIGVPEVLVSADDLLVLEWVDEGPLSDHTEAHLGASLATLHRRPVAGFGRPDRATTGSRRLPNEPASDWVEFFAANRLLPLARLARDERALGDDVVTRLEALADVLPAMDSADEEPALLHGDLWAGNRLVGSDGRNWLIDPAAHHGHREFDLAMMRLFGGFGDDAFRAYDEVYPLQPGWEDRLVIHQLAPLAVHAIKFGGGYVAAAERAVDAAERVFRR